MILYQRFIRYNIFFGVCTVLFLWCGSGLVLANQQKKEDPILLSYLYYSRAVLDQLEGRYNRAEKNFQLAMKYAPTPIPMLQELADMYLRIGKVSKAEVLLEKTLQFNPGNERLWYLYAQSLELRYLQTTQKKYYLKAVEAYEKYFELTRRPSTSALERYAFLLADKLEDIQAPAHMQKLVKKWPDNPRLLEYMTRYYILLSDENNAYTWLKKWIRLDPASNKAWRFAPLLVAQLENWDDFFTFLESIWSTTVPVPRGAESLVSKLFEHEKYDIADRFVKLYFQKKGPLTPQLALYKSELIYRREGPSPAYAYLTEQSSSFDPSKAWKILERRLFYLMKGNRYKDILSAGKEVLKIIHKELDVEPAVHVRLEASVHRMVGRAYEIYHRYKQAQKHFELSYELQKNPLTLYYLTTVYIKLHRFSKARSLIQEGKTTYVRLSSIWRTLEADIASEQGHINKADRILRSHLKTNEDLRTYIQFCLRYRPLHTCEQVLEHQSTNLGKSADFYLLKGVLAEQKGDVEQALQAFERAVTLEPDNPVYLNSLGYALAVYKRNLNRAEALLKKALKLSKENPSYYDSLAWIYFQKREYEKAHEWIQKALLRLDYDPVVLEHAGDITRALGKEKQALQYWYRALQIHEQGFENLEFKPEKVLKKMRKHCQSLQLENIPECQYVFQNKRESRRPEK